MKKFFAVLMLAAALILPGLSSPAETVVIALGQRAGPTRLKFRLSPDFRAAVSLGLLTFALNPLDGKRLKSRGCAASGERRWTTLLTSVDGRDSLWRINDLACPQKAGQPARASRFSSSSSHSISAASSFSCAASRAFMVEAKPEGSRL